MDPVDQIEAVAWNRDATCKIAHMMGTEFVQWLISQALEGKWSQEDVGSVLCRKNAENQIILATLDEQTQKKVAVFNKAKTCSVIPFMEEQVDFLQWLYQEAVEGQWDHQMVFKALAKEEFDGSVVITARIKPGISLNY